MGARVLPVPDGEDGTCGMPGTPNPWDEPNPLDGTLKSEASPSGLRPDADAQVRSDRTGDCWHWESTNVWTVLATETEPRRLARETNHVPAESQGPAHVTGQCSGGRRGRHLLRPFSLAVCFLVRTDVRRGAREV